MGKPIYPSLTFIDWHISMSALVIKSWQAETKPIDEKNNYINITGRESGLIAWLLSLVGVDPTTKILVGLDRIEFSSTSLAGTEFRMIPLQSICSSYYGYHKPWKAAASFIAFFMFIGLSLGADMAKSGEPGGAFTAFIVSTLIGTALGLVYYFLNRTLTLGFVENGGVINGIKFKRSVIENIDINQAQAQRVCLLLQKLIEAKEKRASQAST